MCHQAATEDSLYSSKMLSERRWLIEDNKEGGTPRSIGVREAVELKGLEGFRGMIYIFVISTEGEKLISGNGSGSSPSWRIGLG